MPDGKARVHQSKNLSSERTVSSTMLIKVFELVKIIIGIILVMMLAHLVLGEMGLFRGALF